MFTYAMCGVNCVNVENLMSSRQLGDSVTSSRSHNVAKPLQRFRLLGIRAQLTLWYTIVFAILILLFGTVFYVNLHMSLVSSFDDALRLRTQQIAAGIAEENGTIPISHVTGRLPGIMDGDEVKGAATAGGIKSRSEHGHRPHGAVVALVRLTRSN